MKLDTRFPIETGAGASSGAAAQQVPPPAQPIAGNNPQAVITTATTRAASSATAAGDTDAARGLTRADYQNQIAQKTMEALQAWINATPEQKQQAFMAFIRAAEELNKTENAAALAAFNQDMARYNSTFQMHASNMNQTPAMMAQFGAILSVLSVLGGDAEWAQWCANKAQEFTRQVQALAPTTQSVERVVGAAPTYVGPDAQAQRDRIYGAEQDGQTRIMATTDEEIARRRAAAQQDAGEVPIVVPSTGAARGASGGGSDATPAGGSGADGGGAGRDSSATRQGSGATTPAPAARQLSFSIGIPQLQAAMDEHDINDRTLFIGKRARLETILRDVSDSRNDTNHRTLDTVAETQEFVNRAVQQGLLDRDQATRLMRTAVALSSYTPAAAAPAPAPVPA